MSHLYARFQFLVFVTAVGLTSASSATAQSKADARKIAFFENRVRPLLSEHCFECHNGTKQEGGVRLDLRDAMLAGGDSGAAIVPGKPEESLLIEAVRYEGFEMPPDNPLPEEDVDVLVQWIRDGAVWPAPTEPMTPSLGDQDAIRLAADDHWAFQPIERPELPKIDDPDWALQPLDYFVYAKLTEHGLKPSPRMNRVGLVRRAFHDLVGLPPTPEIVNEIFGAKSLSGLTYVEIIDGLLASPHYGERMARHWMDVARYADTRDFLAAADLRYPFAYTYRDWLIRAFNDDMPYDEFIKQQLAADFVAGHENDPNLAALGFLTVGPMFRNNAPERIADRIDTVSRGLMGITASCARCHDHKYDPISIEDYYSLYGVFRDSRPPDELPVIDSPLGATIEPSLFADYQKQRAAAVKELTDYQAGLARDARKELVKRFDDYLVGYVEMNVHRTETTRGLKSKRKLDETALTPIAQNLDRFRADKKNLTDPVLGALAAVVVAKDKGFAQRKERYLAKVGTKLPPAIRKAIEDSKDSITLASEIGKVLNSAVGSEESSLEAVREVLDDQAGKPFHITAKAASNASRLLGLGRRKLQELSESIQDVDATHAGAPPKAMSLNDADRFTPVFVMLRGEPSRRGPQVERGFLDYFSGNTSEKSFENGSGRLELAEKICAPQNPLTSRVLVNRIWRMHFGRGLVNDAGDFGLRSDPPVQREVMDYLASTVIGSGWSIKKLHRIIMLSSTYRQQSSTASPSMRSDGTPADEIDADNSLLWRQNRRRLDFETMRDHMLAVAGTIDLAIGGRSVRLSEEPHPRRRTVYAYIDRVEPDPVFATFDVASPDVSTSQRTETLVPQQALFAMNNPFVTEQARALVADSEFVNAASSEERINILAERVLQRPARPNEQAMLSRFVESADEMMEDAETPVWQYGYGPIDGSPHEFTPLNHFSGSRYTYEATFPSKAVGYLMLSASGGHPGKDATHAIVRRWTAPEDLFIRIAGTLERKSDRGDGIRAVVRINENSVAEYTLKTGEEKTSAGFHKVKAGDVVDFAVEPLKTSTSDGFRWTVIIEDRVPGEGKVTRAWRSSQDFEGPPPPPLSPWEQAAQALLMTNEFLFVD